MKTLPNRIFFTGVPGSRWSGIAQVLETIDGFNISDRTTSRDYSHGSFSGHKGSYFGNGMEFDATLDADYIDQAWREPAGCRLVKSHDWAYNLDDTYEFAKRSGDWLMLVYRPDLTSFAWWHEAGGFKIAYPSYSWYENSTKMLAEIQTQNNSILKFAHKKNATWSYFTPQWQIENFGSAGQGQVPADDILVTLLK